MLEWLRSLSPRTEFVAVIALAFGWAIVSSTASVLAGPPAPAAAPEFTAGGLWGIVFLELMTLALLTVLLGARGWTWPQLSRPWVRSDLLIGPALLLAAYLSYAVLATLASSSGIALREPTFEHGVGWAAVLGVSVVNGFYEEALVCAYVIAALRERWGLWPAIHASTAIRTAYHLYQGSAGVLSIVPMGLIFAGWYARTGRLWPLILAHVLADALALSVMV